MKYLRKAVDYLYADQGLDACSEEEFLAILDKIKDIDWKRVDLFLGTLRRGELETFCIGDQEDMLIIVGRHGEEGEYAHAAMDTLFEEIGT